MKHLLSIAFLFILFGTASVEAMRTQEDEVGPSKVTQKVLEGLFKDYKPDDTGVVTIDVDVATLGILKPRKNVTEEQKLRYQYIKGSTNKYMFIYEENDLEKLTVTSLKEGSKSVFEVKSLNNDYRSNMLFLTSPIFEEVSGGKVRQLKLKDLDL